MPDITTIEWNRDMTAAPRGSRVVCGVAKGKGGAERQITEFRKQHILACINDNGTKKVVMTYRAEPTPTSPTGWWAGCTEEQVYAWADWPEAIDLVAGGGV